VVEASSFPVRTVSSSMLSTYEVFEPLHLHMLWMGMIWNHHHHHHQPITAAAAAFLNPNPDSGAGLFAVPCPVRAVDISTLVSLETQSKRVSVPITPCYNIVDICIKSSQA
jgi:hypothetical protein